MIKDLNGQEVHLGDEVFYSPRRYGFPVLATVTKITQTLDRYKYTDGRVTTRERTAVAVTPEKSQPFEVLGRRNPMPTTWRTHFHVEPRIVKHFVKATDVRRRLYESLVGGEEEAPNV